MKTEMIKFLDLQKVTALHGAEINEAVSRVVNGGWYLQGEENRRFEADYSAYIGTRYTVGCGNGLDASTIAVLSGFRDERVLRSYMPDYKRHIVHP